MSTWCVYVLKSLKDGKHYIGSTANILVRLKQHNNGRNKSTKSRRPFSLVYKEEHQSRGEAFKREMQIKSYRGGEAFKNLLQRRDERVGGRAVNCNRL